MADFFYLVENIKVNTWHPYDHSVYTCKSTATQIKLVLTITSGPFPLSPVMSCEAEHTNGDEDGQDNIKDHNGYYRSHVDHITGTTFCGREKRLEDKTQTHHHHHIHSTSYSSERFRKARYPAVLLQTLKDRE